MSENSKNLNENRKDPIFDEFLFKTIVSLKTTLISIEKDSDEKTDLLHDLADSMTAVAFNMKDMKERSTKNNDDHTKIMELVEKMRGRLDLVEVKLESENTQINENVKEIKYAVQQFEKLLIEMKALKTVKIANEDTRKKFDILGLMEDLWGAIKNVKMILLAILAIALLVSIVIGGHGLIAEIIKALKGLIG